MPGFIPLESSDGYQLLDSDSEELLVLTDELSIGFCVSSAEVNRLDKTAFLSQFEWITGTLRDESSIVNPSIVIEWSGFPEWNYAYIPNFNRFYFIAEISSVHKDIWRITFREDPLMTYKDQIRNTFAMVDRNEFSYDPFMLDELYPPKYNKQVTEYTAINVAGFSPGLTFKTDVDLTYLPHVAVTTYNNRYYNINDDEPSPDPGYLPNIVGNNFVSGLGYKTYAMNEVELSALTDELFANSDRASFILSVVVFPYELKTLDAQYPLVIGSHNSGGHYSAVKSPLLSYATFADFMVDTPKSFIDYEPYTTRELYIPYAGWFKIPFEVCAGHEVLVYYSIDQMQGNATAYVYDKTGKRMLWSSPCQMGTKIPVSTTNNLENKKTEDSSNLNLIMSMIGSAAAVGIGAYSGNPVAVAGGVLSGTNAIASFIDKRNHIIDRAQATAASAFTGMSSHQKCRIRKTYNFTLEYDEDFAHQFGKPLRQVRKLSAMSGHTVVSSIHLEIPNAYPAEVDAIESILKSGFIA